MAFPYEIKKIGGNLGEELLKTFKGNKSGLVQVGPKKYCLPKIYTKFAEDYYNFKLRQDDVWIMTYPRSGTTLTQELVWLINNDLDYNTASKIPLYERVPFFEFDMIFDDKYLEEVAEINNDTNAPKKVLNVHVPGCKFGPSMKSPRHLKTHLPPSLLPPNLIDTCKVIYVARNPYDVAVSFYHHNQLFRAIDFQGDFTTFWDFFERDLTMYSPYWEHLEEAWKHREHPNLLFLFYEDLLRDMPGSLRKIGKFLNKTLSEDDINKLDQHLHIDNFRKNVLIRGPISLDGLVNVTAQDFIRKGKIGENEEITDEIRTRIDKWFQDNLAKSDIKFPKFK